MQRRAYRAFEIGEDGHFAGRIHLRHCSNDESAKQWAKRLVNGKTIELRDGSRRIARFEPTNSATDPGWPAMTLLVRAR
jgi:hypothetical protein